MTIGDTITTPGVGTSPLDDGVSAPTGPPPLTWDDLRGPIDGAPAPLCWEPGDTRAPCAVAPDGIPEVTIDDLAAFVPAAPAVVSEPGGSGVVGMPTNFVASASAQVIAGTLFDRPVSVRFTPAAYVWEYGDGTTARTADGGTPWEASGQPQFTVTPTAHAYGARGDFAATVTVEYSADVYFGTGWIPVPGVVRATAGPHPVTVYEVQTALVARTCVEDPAGPGC